MKQYWSFFKSGKFAFLALFFVSLTVISCDNDDDNNVSPDPPIEKGEIELAENAQALNYFDFINPNDVEILNADTTQIRVSQAYLDKIKTKVNKNDVCLYGAALTRHLSFGRYQMYRQTERMLF